MSGEMALVILIIIGIIGRASVLATAASLLLVMKLSNLQRFFPILERRGLDFGLLCLMIVVLIPLISEKIQVKLLLNQIFSIPGLCGLIGGLLATYFNGQGLGLLRSSPQLMVAMVIGSIMGIIFLKGIPVGPLMAAAIAALLLKVIEMIF